MAKALATCGKICCGKTTYARSLIEKQGGVLLSCDEITHGILGGQLGDKHDEILIKVQKYLLSKALEILRSGTDVILDWGLWTREQRIEIRRFFCQNGFEYELHYIDIPNDEWYKRIERRNAEVANELSRNYYVDGCLLQKAISLFQPPYDDEIDLKV